jgi:hypothetical protein
LGSKVAFCSITAPLRGALKQAHKNRVFLSPFIDTVDAKVCIFNLQSISQAERRGFPVNVAPERVFGPHGVATSSTSSVVRYVILFLPSRQFILVAASRYQQWNFGVQTVLACTVNGQFFCERIAGPACAESNARSGCFRSG